MSLEARPLVTFAMFAYNQERFVGAAVEAVLAQTYEPLEIILSDDGSRDRTFEIMQQKVAGYRGPHQVIVRRNEPNVGLAEHVNVVVAQARGELLVVAAGDDISDPRRCEIVAAEFARSDALSFVDTATDEIDDLGAFIRRTGIPGERRWVTMEQFLRGRAGPLTAASRAYRTASLRRFPPLARECPTEDTPGLLRCLMLGEGLVLGDALVKRRLHDTNLSGPASLGQMNLKAIERQYMADAAFALRENLVSPGLYRRICAWAASTIFVRVFKQDLANGGVGVMSGVRRALLQPGVSPKARLSALRTVASTKRARP